MEVDWFVVKERRIEEGGGLEEHEARMKAVYLRRFGPGGPGSGVAGGIASVVEDTVVAGGDAVAVADNAVVVVHPPSSVTSTCNK